MKEIEKIIVEGENILRETLKFVKNHTSNSSFDLLIISGPSGVGKGTIMKLLEERIKIEKIPIYTTRKKRKDEIHGKHYYFITKEEFENLLNKGMFLVHGKVHECLQGVGKELLEKVRKSNKKFYIEIHISLAKKLLPVLRMHGIRYLYVFILPPTYKDLFSRLINRGEKDLEIISLRLKNGIMEIKESLKLDCFYVINDVLEECVEKLIKIISS